MRKIYQEKLGFTVGTFKEAHGTKLICQNAGAKSQDMVGTQLNFYLNILLQNISHTYSVY